jgi:RNA polymerase sigma-70 factor, ECF subfamily
LRRLTRDTAWQITEGPAMIDGAKDAEQRVMLERLRKQIELLPTKFRSVLQLSLVEEMEAADVGAVLGIPAGTVRSRVHTARKLLLEAMK